MIRALKLIFVQQALAEYVTSDEYAAVFVSSDLSFENITHTNSSLAYPLRLTDGLYGIGAWSKRVELETIFIGYEDDETLNFSAWIASTGSTGCNSSDYSHVQALKKDPNSDFYIGIFANQISRIILMMTL